MICMIFKRPVTSCLPECFYMLYFPPSGIFMLYLNRLHSKICIIMLNQRNHMSSLFHDYCPINNNCIHIWMNSSAFYDSQQAFFVNTNFVWLDISPHNDFMLIDWPISGFCSSDWLSPQGTLWLWFSNLISTHYCYCCCEANYKCT